MGCDPTMGVWFRHFNEIVRWPRRRHGHGWRCDAIPKLEGGSVPLRQRCRWNVGKELPLLLDSIATVLNPDGRCVLLMKGYKRLEGLLDRTDEDPPRPCSKLRLVERRDVNVGGFLCYALVLAHNQT